MSFKECSILPGGENNFTYKDILFEAVNGILSFQRFYYTGSKF